MNRPSVGSLSTDQCVNMNLYSHRLDELIFRYENEKNENFRTNSFGAINRPLPIPSCEQTFRFHAEEQPLRVHVGNIPFLWTIDDLRKQFLVFGPVKDPEIVSNERGSKGFGFITFLRQSDGMNAIRVKNGSIADGRKITVAKASSRSSSQIVLQNGAAQIHHCCCNKNHS